MEKGMFEIGLDTQMPFQQTEKERRFTSCAKAMMVEHLGHVGRPESCILGGKLGEWKLYLNIEIGSYFKAS